MLIHVHIYTHRARFLPSLSHCNITMIESVLKSCENSTISLSSEMSKVQASLKGYSHLYWEYLERIWVFLGVCERVILSTSGDMAGY